MANISDRQRDHFMLRGKLAKRGCDWWWHSFTAEDAGQLHRFFPWKEVSLPYDTDLNLRAGDCGCSETRMYGSISLSPQEAKAHPEYMCNAGEMSWDI